MLPPLKIVKQGLRRTTEALAAELAQPGGAMPDWNHVEWQLASAVAAAHGVSPLLEKSCRWANPDWQRFLRSQREHVAHRHRHIAALLERIDAGARAIALTVVPLKGSALHALGLCAPGDRPMADIDLLVREGDVDAAIELLKGLGYVEQFVVWKHRVFKPATGQPFATLGEHRDTPINIELHTRIQERLPVSTVVITERIYPRAPRAGLAPYPSLGALMSHLLLHAAGNICHRSLRLLHLHDIAALAARMSASDWDVLWDEHAAGSPWWALPPLRLVARYYGEAIPAAVLARLAPCCPPLLRMVSRRQNLTQLSCSELWHHTLHGIEWLSSARDVRRYIANRVTPTEEAVREHQDMLRTQFWLREESWVGLPRSQRFMTVLTRRLPRMDTLYIVRAALEPSRKAAVNDDTAAELELA